jgi:predicted DNA-binding protein with PD1-like motif
VTYSATDYGYALSLEPGDEVMRCLIQFARDEEVDAAVITGIGSLAEVELGAAAHGGEERRGRLAEPLEACSITGLLTLVDGQPFPHLHGSFARQDYSVVGGHIYQAVCGGSVELAVQPTCETAAMPQNTGATTGAHNQQDGT